MLDTAPILGLSAAGLGIVDTVPYIRDTLRGTTRPHRGTWLIWAVLAVVATFSQRADGASWSLALTTGQAVVTALVFALATRYGEPGVAALDRWLLVVAAAGVLGWLIAREPLVAVACVIVADLAAAAMMTPKAYRDPYSETLVMYACASVGGALAAGAVGSPDVTLLLYPVYYCLANGALALVILLARRHSRERSPAS